MGITFPKLKVTIFSYLGLHNTCHCHSLRHCHSQLCTCSRECILDVHEHICSLYICSDKNTSAALGRLHWLQASLT